MAKKQSNKKIDKAQQKIGEVVETAVLKYISGTKILPYEVNVAGTDYQFLCCLTESAVEALKVNKVDLSKVTKLEKLVDECESSKVQHQFLTIRGTNYLLFAHADEIGLCEPSLLDFHNLKELRKGYRDKVTSSRSYWEHFTTGVLDKLE